MIYGESSCDICKNTFIKKATNHRYCDAVCRRTSISLTIKILYSKLVDMGIPPKEADYMSKRTNRARRFISSSIGCVENLETNVQLCFHTYPNPSQVQFRCQGV